MELLSRQATCIRDSKLYMEGLLLRSTKKSEGGCSRATGYALHRERGLAVACKRGHAYIAGLPGDQNGYPE